MVSRLADKIQPAFVSASTAKSLSNFLLKQGLDPDLLTHTLQNSLASLDTVDARLPMEVYHNLWHLALDYTGNPALGLMLGSNSNNDDMGLVGHIFFNNATLGEALKQYERFYSLINDGMHIEIKTQNDEVQLEYICDRADAYCLPDMDRTLAIAIHRARENISRELVIERVGFQHAAPEYEDEYAQVFPCPVVFNQAHTHLVFKKRYLDFKLPNRSPYLYKVLNHHIESLLRKIRPEPSLTDKVKKLIERKLSKDSVDAERIAEKLCMSRHTLYRKLKQEGVAFHELVDQVREEKALAYLNDSQHNLSEIAFLLGFSELSAFSRAFKRWTGESPAKYLERKYIERK